MSRYGAAGDAGAALRGRRARELRAQGVRDLDALHLAAAEQGGAEVLLTTDDRFVQAARALQPASRVRVEKSGTL